MAPDLPSGMGGFFPGMLGDLLRLLRTDEPIQWDLALQLAQRVASGDGPEANVDPVDRIRLEGLLGVAELHVADVTGMTTTPGGQPLSIVATGRSEWARRSLEGWRPVVEQIASALAPPPGASTPPGVAVAAGEEPDADDVAAFIAQWATAIAPAMLAMQVGSVVGHLAERALGQYELPLPRRSDSELLVVPGNAKRFAEDWSLPPDDLFLWLCVHDVATHSVLTRSHVRSRLESLLVAQARGFRPDPKALEQRLGEAVSGIGSDVPDLTRLLGDPGAFGEIEDTPETRRVRAELSALSSAVAGYAQWVTDTVAQRAIGARSAIGEAMRRRRVERGDEERVAESLFGLRLDQESVDRGESFVRGVVERTGDAELAKLWVVEGALPTPAELDAPGLWIERVNLPPLDDLDPPAAGD
ncbi:MAG: zinc-dependent metalloprotease [Actinomycetota bacterium]|nr:zinc-dependent metalloprotease [Actinomycetota bacterium]